MLRKRKEGFHFEVPLFVEDYYLCELKAILIYRRWFLNSRMAIKNCLQKEEDKKQLRISIVLIVKVMNRRNFVKTATILGAAVPFANISANVLSKHSAKTEICSFSKLFQFLNYDELAALFKESGLDGIDLTVRKGGHVLPENVERDLPKAAKAAQKYGISIPSISTDVATVDDPLTERVLKTASDCGIKHYRLAYYSYDYNQSIPANFEMIRVKMERLSELNVKYGIQGGYQNHCGTYFGATTWEVWNVIKDMDKKKMGCFYDVYHGVVEGTQSWKNAMRLIAPHITMRYIKDFHFTSANNLEPVPCPLGKGVVDFKAYFQLCKELNLDAPICLHVEYPLFDNEKNMSHAEKYKKALSIMKNDTDKLKSLMAENGVV